MTTSLSQLPDNVAASLELISLLDDGFAVGLGRLGDERLTELQALTAAFAATPIADRVAAALAGLGRGVLEDEAVMSFAFARRSIMGAVHDALREQALAALGLDGTSRTEGSAGPSEPAELDADLEGPLTGARLWLGELALTGFSQLSNAALMPFASSLERLAVQPELRRASAILTGFHAELVEAMPIQSRDAVPDRRWGDLWSAAALATRGPIEVERRAVKANLLPLGADVRHHDRVIACNIWAIAEVAKQEPQIVTVPFMAWKVDALDGADALRALPPPAKTMLAALTKKTGVSCSGQLGGDGTLVISGDDAVAQGDKTDPLTALAAAGPLAPAPIQPAERHPIHLGFPVLGEITDEATFTVEGGESLPIATERISPLLTAKSGDLADATTAVGLLRFDGRWEVQPLTAKVGRGLWGIGEVAAAAAKPAKANAAAAVLRERASRLLRS